jgi:hypothetical protein
MLKRTCIKQSLSITHCLPQKMSHWCRTIPISSSLPCSFTEGHKLVNRQRVVTRIVISKPLDNHSMISVFPVQFGVIYLLIKPSPAWKCKFLEFSLVLRNYRRGLCIRKNAFTMLRNLCTNLFPRSGISRLEPLTFDHYVAYIPNRSLSWRWIHSEEGILCDMWTKSELGSLFWSLLFLRHLACGILANRGLSGRVQSCWIPHPLSGGSISPVTKQESLSKNWFSVWQSNLKEVIRLQLFTIMCSCVWWNVSQI